MPTLLFFGTFNTEWFSPPRPPGVAAVQRTFDIHFDTFYYVLEAVIRDGMASPAGSDTPSRSYFQGTLPDLRRPPVILITIRV